jgi:diacylglycerol kinase
VLALGAFLDLSRGDWCWLVVAIAMVWAAECMNTALESLADATAPDPHPLVGRAKDAAAGAVLCASIGAAVIGLLVLGRPLLAWWVR